VLVQRELLERAQQVQPELWDLRVQLDLSDLLDLAQQGQQVPLEVWEQRVRQDRLAAVLRVLPDPRDLRVVSDRQGHLEVEPDLRAPLEQQGRQVQLDLPALEQQDPLVQLDLAPRVLPDQLGKWVRPERSDPDRQVQQDPLVLQELPDPPERLAQVPLVRQVPLGWLDPLAP